MNQENMNQKTMYHIEIVSEDEWHHSPIGTLEREIQISHVCQNLGYHIVLDRIIVHKSEWNAFINSTLKRAINYKNCHQNLGEQFYLCIPYETFVCKSTGKIKDQVTEQFIIKAYDDLVEEYERLNETKKFPSIEWLKKMVNAIKF